MSLTTDPNDSCLNTPKGEGEQNECYLILSEEERSKGFVRPYRDSYIHVGRNVKSHWKSLHRILDEDEKKEYKGKYFAVMTVITNEDGTMKGGTYVTKEEYDAWKNGKRINGCGGVTTMARELSETYARNPKFYGATWCTHCKDHLEVNEFIWNDGSGETVGT